MPAELRWAKWRLVAMRWATLEEIDRHWSLVDLHDANRLADELDKAEQWPDSH